MQGDDAITKGHWAFIVVSVRDPRTDFRCDLVSALRSSGAAVTYIRLGRRCFIDGGSTEGGTYRSPFAVLALLLRASARQTCVLLSVNTGFPLFSLAMRACSPRALWLFDEHDDLLYTARGLRRRWERLKLAVFRTLATRSICVSPKLCERTPHGVLVPNASPVRRLVRPKLDWSRVLVLSNIDARFDFALIARFLAAHPPVEVHVFGDDPKDATLAARLQALRREPRFQHHGAYRTADIQRILDAFSVMLVPYKVDASTHFIDPLRYYHGLNGGLEILTTRISRARDLHERLHLIDDGADAAALLDDLRAGRRHPKNQAAFPPESWEARARDLLALVDALRSRDGIGGRAHIPGDPTAKRA